MNELNGARSAGKLESYLPIVGRKYPGWSCSELSHRLLPLSSQGRLSDFQECGWVSLVRLGSAQPGLAWLVLPNQLLASLSLSLQVFWSTSSKDLKQ